MAQVKKFLNGSAIKAEEGNKSPEPQRTYGHIWVDGIDYGNSEELYNAFANHARSQGLNQGEFYDQWLTALRNGQDVVFGNGNTVNIQPKDMSEKQAGKRSGWTKFWNDTFDTRRNHFSNAIATARGFTFTPKQVEKEETAPAAKKNFETPDLFLDYNDDPKKKGHKVWSATHQNNLAAIKRVADVIAGLNDPDNSEYTYNDALKNAYEYAKSHPTEGFEGEWTPQAFADALFARLQNPTWTGYKDPANNADLDWLEAFGIKVAPVSSSDSAGSSSSSSNADSVREFKGPDGKIYTADENGNLSLKEEQETPIDDTKVPVKEDVPVADQSKPTLITPEMASAMGLDPSYNFGLIYNGQNFTPEHIKIHSYLGPLMEQVESWNRDTNLTQADRYRNINGLINVPDIKDYVPYNESSTSVSNYDLKKAFDTLGISSAAVYKNPTISENGVTFKYFNDRIPGINPWGFRSAGSVFLGFDDSGKKVKININTPDNRSGGIRDYYLDRRFTHKNNPYMIVHDEDGKYYITSDLSKFYGKPGAKNYHGVMIGNKAIDPEIAKSIIGSGNSDTITGLFEKGGKIDFAKVNAFAKGDRVVKGQNGISKVIIPEVKLKDFNFNYTIPDDNTGITAFADDYFFNNTFKPLIQSTIKSKKKQNSFLDSYEGQTGDYTRTDVDYGDTNYNSTPAWTSFIKGGLSALDYGSMAWGRHKVHDQIEKGLRDSLYKRVTPRLQGITTATPIEDAAVDRYDQYVQRGLTTPLTSDNVTNTQNVLTLQANALQGRDQAVRQQSAAALQRQMQNQQIANQQNTLDAEAENDFRARLAGLKMNLAQNDASLTAQIAQSVQNLAREWRTKFNEQTGKYNQLQYNTAVSDQTELSDNAWKNYLRTNQPDAWNAWNNMSTTDRNKYGNDITTWIQQSDYWNDALQNQYLSNRKTLNQNILSAYKDYNLSPELAWLYKDRYGVPEKKSGGTLTIKQRNRYKNEPWEDIWINQNKATHKLVAKLNDNVIKTFLKTLK